MIPPGIAAQVLASQSRDDLFSLQFEGRVVAICEAAPTKTEIGMLLHGVDLVATAPRRDHYELAARLTAASGMLAVLSDRLLALAQKTMRDCPR